MSRHEKVRSLIASSLLAAILLALGLAASPQLHARLHPDADSPSHECAVTLIAAGKYELTDAPPVLIAPQPVTLFEKVPTFTPVQVPAPYLSAALLEHAPPALS